VRLNAQKLTWKLGEARFPIGDTAWTLVVVQAWMRACKRGVDNVKPGYFEHKCDDVRAPASNIGNLHFRSNLDGLSMELRSCQKCNEVVPRQGRMFLKLLLLGDWDEL
jgi:hypothetical protein